MARRPLELANWMPVLLPASTEVASAVKVAPPVALQLEMTKPFIVTRAADEDSVTWPPVAVKTATGLVDNEENVRLGDERVWPPVNVTPRSLIVNEVKDAPPAMFTVVPPALPLAAPNVTAE